MVCKSTSENRGQILHRSHFKFVKIGWYKNDGMFNLFIFADSIAQKDKTFEFGHFSLNLTNYNTRIK